ncbi:MAG: hypothetical protein R2681_04935 [Pyrinomonadaceae bacterium]
MKSTLKSSGIIVLMEDRSIHKNLDTSFVNLSALIKYLRRRQFSGSVKIQLNGYRAEITLRGDNTIAVHEHDEISGRVSDGEEALQRLLIRAREPGGSINVFQAVSAVGAANGNAGRIAESPKPVPAVSAASKPAETIIPKPSEPLPAVRPVSPHTNGAPKRPGKPNHGANVQNTKLKIQKTDPARAAKRTTSLPDFPFNLTNKVEARAQQELSSPEDWQTLMKLTVELLTVVDRSLAAANLNFSIEFRKICTEIAGDYPFLNPPAEIFSYSKGRIRMRKQTSAKIFISGVAEALRRILLKLSKSGKYSEIYKLTSQRLQVLLNKRASVYERFAITPQIRRIISR